MDPEFKKRLDDQDEMFKKIYSSVEKTRKYFLWTLIISIAAIVPPPYRPGFPYSLCF
jgi:hypothetical protein